MANDHQKNDNRPGRNGKKSNHTLKKLRQTVKKEFGSAMEEILGASSLTKKDQQDIISQYETIISLVDSTGDAMLDLKHLIERIASKLKN